MLESVLLHLNDNSSGAQALQLGVALAQRHEARVRGLTLLDTRRLESVLSHCEAAVYATTELDRLNQHQRNQEIIRSRFCQACLSAGVDFDLRSIRANPCEVFSQEARFHDLVLAACPAPDCTQQANPASGLTPAELVDLMFQGVQPMLVVRGASQILSRVLLVCDGSSASSRAIRSFLQQGLFPDAECRLLAIGDTEEQTRECLREMASYCRSTWPSLETGYLRGSARKVLIPYAEKWRADLIVFGVRRKNRVLQRLFGETARDILKKTPFALYAVG